MTYAKRHRTTMDRSTANKGELCACAHTPSTTVRNQYSAYRLLLVYLFVCFVILILVFRVFLLDFSFKGSRDLHPGSRKGRLACSSFCYFSFFFFFNSTNFCFLFYFFLLNLLISLVCFLNIVQMDFILELIFR